ncbi:MAG: NAD(P)H-dependent oxidoreductase [Oscillospiraceae bacterium]|nr:NAD(P)H-dependent oxidoreductase [Oscillospiraceae bacterium]
MSKKLVAYFSASGVTKDAANKIAKAANAELYEIRPEVAYTKADLDWNNKDSRSSVEMNNKNLRPAIADKNANIEDFDVIFLGFPVWWYTAPTILNTFLESYDFSDKRIILFATSGSSGFENSLSDLKVSVSAKAVIEEGIVVHGTQDEEAWKKWVDSFSL